MVYALADRGARLLIERDGIEFANVKWSRKNRKAGRPFIEHSWRSCTSKSACNVRRALAATCSSFTQPGWPSPISVRC